MYAILIVQVRETKWSFSITRNDRTIYASTTFWDSPEDLLEAALAEYHEAARGRYQNN